VARKRTPREIIGAPIPTRDRTVRREVVRLYEANTHLAVGDVQAVTRYAHLAKLTRNAEKDLDANGLTRQDGEPRKFGWLYLSFLKEARDLESALGLTATARAKLGVDVLRMENAALARWDFRDQVVEDENGGQRLVMGDEEHMTEVMRMAIEFVGADAAARLLVKQLPKSMLAAMLESVPVDEPTEPEPPTVEPPKPPPVMDERPQVRRFVPPETTP
jgi:hypothetical protein